VTVGAPVTWNLPEYFEKRQRASMDLAAIAGEATPELITEISARYPSFSQQAHFRRRQTPPWNTPTS
jgi:hypothetical protein